MAQRIDVPGMGIVEFPDDMSDDQIASAIKQNMPAEPPQGSGNIVPGSRFEAAPSVGQPGYVPPVPSAPQPNLGDYIAASGQVAATIAASPFAGIAGLAKLVTGAPSEEAAKSVLDIQKSITTKLAGEVETPEEAEALNQIGKQFASMAQPSEAIGEYLLEKVGPKTATAGSIILDPYNLIGTGVIASGAVATRKALQAASKVQTKAMDALVDAYDRATVVVPKEVKSIREMDTATLQKVVDNHGAALKIAQDRASAGLPELPDFSQNKILERVTAAAEELDKREFASTNAVLQLRDTKQGRFSKYAEEELTNKYLDELDFQTQRNINLGQAPIDAVASAKAKIGWGGKPIQLPKTRDGDLGELLRSNTQAAVEKEPTSWMGKQARAGIEKVDWLTGVWEDRVRRVSPRLMFATRAVDDAKSKQLHQVEDWLVPLIKDWKTVTLAARKAAEDAYFSGSEQLTPFIDALRQNNADNSAASVEANLRSFLHTKNRELADIDPSFKSRGPDYMPLAVKDYEGLLNATGRETKTAIEKALTEAANKKGSRLDDFERDAIINSHLKIVPKRTSVIGAPNNLKARVSEGVPEELRQFYHSPFDAFAKYAHTTINRVENAKAFGQTTSAGSKGSLGKLLREELDSGKITYGQFSKLTDLLDSRYGLGERSPSRAISATKNLFLTTSIGAGVSSTITQLADLGMSVARMGPINTAKSVLETVMGRSAVGPQDLAIKHISLDMEDTGRTARLLETVLKSEGFQAIDKLGKTVFINAALKKRKSQLNSKQGMRNFIEQYKDAFVNDQEMVQAIRDLRAGKITPQSKWILFNDILDVQPITKGSMTEAEMQHPNARIFYTLKRWTLKTIGLQRRTIMDEVRKGNPVTGARKLAQLSATLALAGATTAQITGFMMGKDEEFSDSVAANFWKNLGTSQYMLDQLSDKGKISAAAGNLMAPPLGMVENAWTDLRNFAQAIQSENEEEMTFRSSRNVPLVGDWLYNYLGGGLEEWQARQERKEAKEARED